MPSTDGYDRAESAWLITCVMTKVILRLSPNQMRAFDGSGFFYATLLHWTCPNEPAVFKRQPGELTFKIACKLIYLPTSINISLSIWVGTHANILCIVLRVRTSAIVGVVLNSRSRRVFVQKRSTLFTFEISISRLLCVQCTGLISKHSVA